MLITITLPSTSNALPTVLEATPNGGKTDAAEAQKLINRLEEIKLMDVKSMTRKQKRQLKHEVKSIEKELHTNGGGIYVSVGALILIILLLIILF